MNMSLKEMKKIVQINLVFRRKSTQKIYKSKYKCRETPHYFYFFVIYFNVWSDKQIDGEQGKQKRENQETMRHKNELILSQFKREKWRKL